MIKSIIKFLKGGEDARGTEIRVSGGNGCERRVVHPVSTICEQAISDFCGIRMLATACAYERSRDIGALSPNPICRESLALIAGAKKAGCFIEKKDVPGTRYTIRTGESEVRLVQKDGEYYKIKNPFAKLHLKRHSERYVIFEHVIHNIMFPDCRLEFVGIAEDYHEARIVYRQNTVRSELRPEDGQIAEILNQMGLSSDNRYEFGNEFLFVTDVGQDDDNVLVDDENRIRFIDPIIGFKSSLQELLMCALESDKDVAELVKHLYQNDR